MNASEPAPARVTPATRVPRIGITAEERDERGTIHLPTEFFDAVLRAGGLPLIIPVWNVEPGILLDAIDGLILSGGGDIEPDLYGGAHHPAVERIDLGRDETEIALARRGYTTGLPTLGICRGAQVINVALGGTLIEDIESERLTSGGACDGDAPTLHRGHPPAYVPHPVAVLDGTRLAHALGTQECAPLSWHHQSIRALAPGLRVAALAPDGVIEAVEANDASGHEWFVAVQWHPEKSAANDGIQQRLFDAFVEAARVRLAGA